MKKLQNNFTTPEQSKRLLEIGVPADSADFRYINLGLGDYSDIPYWGFSDDDDLPCWSVGRLIEIIKICSIRREPILKILRFIDNTDNIVKFLIFNLGYETQIGRIDFSKLEK